MSRLWYTAPASVWEEALPLGNGRLGGMVYGGILNEKIQLNEESVWYGGEVHRTNLDCKENLPAIREKLLSGKISEAETLMRRAMTGCPDSMHPYQTLGEVSLRFLTPGARMPYFPMPEKDPAAVGAEEYSRNLDLGQAVSTVSFRIGDVRYTRTAFISAVSDGMVLRMEADQKASVSFEARLSRGHFYDGVRKAGNSGVYLYGNLGKGGSEFGILLSAKAEGGSARVIGETLCVEGADAATLYLTAGTSFAFTAGDKQAAFDAEPVPEGAELSDAERQAVRLQYGTQRLLFTRLHETIRKMQEKTYPALLSEHIADYKKYFDRVSLRIEGDPKAESLPSDQRLARLKEKKDDPSIAALYFDYGRYLLISCSRPGTMAATLQGLWNQDFAPAWDSKYTVNINTQMNYWPAESCALPECHQPLFDLIEKMRENGRKTAREMYGCRGFVCHHNTDIRGDTDVQDTWMPGSYWVMGAAWLSTHLWTHYVYTRDLEFLKKTFPILAEASLFFVDFLIDVDGHKMTCPSVSPENSYILPSGEQGANGAGVTMDNQILRDLFSQTLTAAGLLPEETVREAILSIGGNPETFLSEVKKDMDALLPTRIGSDGRILEWREEYQEAEPGHRHISHLYGLFPSEQISVDDTPELAKAAEKTLEYRLSFGGGHTGWSCAWIINHYARLRKGEAAFDNLNKLFTNSTYSNFFDKHPPFQIDGNFGGTAGIVNMLVQSGEEKLILLPALPKKWKKGAVSGIRLHGNASVSLSWEDGKLTGCSIRADSDYRARVIACSEEKKTAEIFVPAGEEKDIGVWLK